MRKLAWTLVIGSITFTTACSKSEPTANNAAGTATMASNTQAPIAQQLAAPATNETVITPPAEVVAQFLDSLRRGDEVTTAQLLTVQAREEVKKHNLEVAPPGSPTATFQIGETREVEADRALVESIWTEPAVEGQEAIKTGVVFDVRKEQNGWRLAGMVIDMGANSEAIVVDFENMSGLLEPTGQQAPAQVATQTQTPAATNNPQAAPAANQGVPATPAGFQQPPASPAFSTPPQLASPPSGGSAGLRR
jgi:hypothetical protein